MPAVETDQPPPKPKKFFKSRNADPYPPVPQITYAPPVPAAPLSPEHPSNSKEKKATKRSRVYNRDSSSPELPRRNSEKTKARKNSVATKASKKEESLPENAEPRSKRYLVRNRDKIINYAEDGSNSPIPEFSRYESLAPRVMSPKTSPLVASPVPSKLDVASPSTSKEVVSPSTSKDSNEERKPPPIVLRISKGTSRIVSTDSNEGFTSPGSDRHSSMDMHSDLGLDQKKSPSMETICSPKHEGIKVTIKFGGHTQDSKKDKKKDKKDGHKSHKKHHKNTDEEVKKPASPLPGSDAYELYKTLASPAHDSDKEIKSKTPSAEDEIEMQLAKLDSTGSVHKSPKADVQPTEPPPEPKPPEGSTGRARRARQVINYNENDDFIDSVTSGRSGKLITKTVSDLKKEGRKGRKKHEAAVLEAAAASALEPELTEEKVESHVEKNDLIDILSGANNNSKPEIKLHKKQKAKKLQNKHSSPDYGAELSQDENIQDQDDNETEMPLEDEPMDTGPDLNINDTGNLNPGTQATDSDYNSCPTEFSEEESQKNHHEDVFKSPHGIDDDHVEDKPSVKLVITKKKGSIFKSKSLVNDNPSPLPARKRRHLYKHEWANDVSKLVYNFFGTIKTKGQVYQTQIYI